MTFPKAIQILADKGELDPDVRAAIIAIARGIQNFPGVRGTSDLAEAAEKLTVARFKDDWAERGAHSGD